MPHQIYSERLDRCACCLCAVTLITNSDSQSPWLGCSPDLILWWYSWPRFLCFLFSQSLFLLDFPLLTLISLFCNYNYSIILQFVDREEGCRCMWGHPGKLMGAENLCRLDTPVTRVLSVQLLEPELLSGPFHSVHSQSQSTLENQQHPKKHSTNSCACSHWSEKLIFLFPPNFRVLSHFHCCKALSVFLSH